MGKNWLNGKSYLIIILNLIFVTHFLFRKFITVFKKSIHILILSSLKEIAKQEFNLA